MEFEPTETPNSAELEAAKTAARRRLIGLAIFLVAGVALLPWVMKDQARPWGETIKIDVPKPTAPVAPPMQPQTVASEAPSGKNKP